MTLYGPVQPSIFLDFKYCSIEINLFSYSHKIFKLIVIVYSNLWPIINKDFSIQPLSQNKIQQSHLYATKDWKLHQIG